MSRAGSIDGVPGGQSWPCEGSDDGDDCVEDWRTHVATAANIRTCTGGVDGVNSAGIVDAASWLAPEGASLRLETTDVGVGSIAKYASSDPLAATGVAEAELGGVGMDADGVEGKGDG